MYKSEYELRGVEGTNRPSDKDLLVRYETTLCGGIFHV